jgi:hypothetical protein
MLSKFVIVIGFIYFVVYDIRAWLVCNNIDDYALVNSYTSTAMFGLAIMAFGFLLRLLR